MILGQIVSVSGCFTKEKFIVGRRLYEIETILGFHRGRLSQGMAVVALSQLPRTDQFELAAYSNVATHRNTIPGGLDIDRLKRNAAVTWATTGFERLVKVFPTMRHDHNIDPDTQYPPGHGAPQWIAKTSLLGRVVGIVSDYPNGIYTATP
jgi:hypothetical protein